MVALLIRLSDILLDIDIEDLFYVGYDKHQT